MNEQRSGRLNRQLEYDDDFAELNRIFEESGKRQQRIIRNILITVIMVVIFLAVLVALASGAIT